MLGYENIDICHFEGVMNLFFWGKLKDFHGEIPVKI